MAANETHGESRKMPPRAAVGSCRRAEGAGTEAGLGWERADRRAMARLPPADSPTRKICWFERPVRWRAAGGRG